MNPRLQRLALVLAAGVLLGGGAWLVNQVRTLPGAGTLAARADQRIVTLEVGGMTCGNCAAHVHGGLAAVKGVTTAEVRLDQQRAIVICDRSVPDSALIGAVSRAGPGFMAAVANR